MKSKVLLITILIVLLSSLFFFSGQNGTVSANTSESFTASVIDIVSNVTKIEISITKKEKIVYEARFIVRKTAHFTLYFLLGVDVFLLLSSYKIQKAFIISII
ncbi:MAG: VanZ family protein, partial [Bacilli bacterium]|nr:VanZ family protein [Bacilli bacterium]